jgi:UDP-N-acetylmuramoyl-tripeptide--D-alanyl-D-alanine ligase
MKELTLSSLAKIIDARIIGSHACPEHSRRDAIRTTHDSSRISTDSRTIQPGDCFFAIAGPNFDGHNFLKDAFAKGAACAVVSKDIPPNQFPDKIILRVKDTVESLGVLAAWYRKDCSFKVVAITGSVGKTTTRQIIHYVLSKHIRVCQSPKSFNNFIGLPLTLLAADPNDDVVIVELGTNHPGEIAYLTRIAEPDIALVTAVAPAHLEGLGDLPAIIAEKLSIADGLRPSGTLLLNGDYPELIDYARTQGRTFRTFGASQSCDYRAENIRSDGLTSTFRISGIDVHLPLPSLGNVQNTVAAWAVCAQFGIAAADFASAVKTLSPVAMRTEIVRIGSLTVINDCYNANPASMKNALDILTTLAENQSRRAACPGEAQRRRVFVCGDMAELGTQSEQYHVELGEYIANAKIDVLLTAGKLAQITASAAKQNARRDFRMRSFADAPQLCDNLQQFIKDSDIILVKGSRTNKLEQVVDKLKELFGESRSRDAGQERRDTK